MSNVARMTRQKETGRDPNDQLQSGTQGLYQEIFQTAVESLSTFTRQPDTLKAGPHKTSLRDRQMHLHKRIIKHKFPNEELRDSRSHWGLGCPRGTYGDPAGVCLGHRGLGQASSHPGTPNCSLVPGTPARPRCPPSAWTVSHWWKGEKELAHMRVTEIQDYQETESEHSKSVQLPAILILKNSNHIHTWYSCVDHWHSLCCTWTSPKPASPWGECAPTHSPGLAHHHCTPLPPSPPEVLLLSWWISSLWSEWKDY